MQVEHCPRANRVVTVAGCNKCAYLGLSRWSMLPICRYESKPGRRENSSDCKAKCAAPARTAHRNNT